MKRKRLELWVGLFVLIGLLCVAYLTIKLGRMEIMGSDFYPLRAEFQSVAGLKPGASVEIAGVQVGQVASIELEPERKVAVVILQIQKNLSITDDVIASIKTSGLIGDKYVNLAPGGSDVILQPGESIAETLPAIDLEELISKYVFGEV